VGRRTFGKGLVQKQYPLSDGSAIRLTVARYHTPTGRVIQRPYEKNDKEYHKEISKRYQKGEMFSMDSINFPDSLKYNTLKLGRSVYGGGGIMPDMFVPVDTSTYTNFYRALIRRGILNQFILSYLDENRKVLTSKFKNFDQFNKGFVVEDNLVDGLLAHAAKSDIKPNEGDMDRSGGSIRIQLKSLLARNLFDQNAFFQTINELDPIYKAAVEIISDDQFYNSILTKKK
jgi:carboxyl-terminal processing protease